MATKSISGFTKEVNGQTVPMWNKEEIDEIIAGVVINLNDNRNRLVHILITLFDSI